MNETNTQTPNTMKQYHIPKEHRTEQFEKLFETYEAANSAFNENPCKGTATALAASRSDVVGVPYWDCLNEAGQKAERNIRFALVSDMLSIAKGI